MATSKEEKNSMSVAMDHRKNSLIGFATLLGTFSLDRCFFSSIMPSTSSSPEKENSEEENDDITGSTCNQQQLTANQTLRFLLSQSTSLESSFPSLSLDSATRHHHKHQNHSEDRSESKAKVEALASYNLARPIIVSSFSKNSAQQFHTTDIASVPTKMLKNFKSSLALLVDARLRAFGTILARHVQTQDPSLLLLHGGAGGCATERKLCALLQVGANLTMDSAVTSFAVVSPAGINSKETQEQQHENMNIVSLQFMFEAVVDVGIPNLITPSSTTLQEQARQNQMDALTINIKCPAIITGHFSEDSQKQLLQAVNVKFDTHVLLSSMISQASLVVMKVVENVNAACSFEPTPILQQQQQQQKNDLDASKVPQDSSTSSLTKQNQQQDNHHQSKDTRQASPTIVSPDFGAMVSCLHDNLHFAPHLDLTTAKNEDNNYKDEDDDELVAAVENCAALIDDVIGGVNDELLHSPPLPSRKKVKFATVNVV